MTYVERLAGQLDRYRVPAVQLTVVHGGEVRHAGVVGADAAAPDGPRDPADRHRHARTPAVRGSDPQPYRT